MRSSVLNRAPAGVLVHLLLMRMHMIDDRSAGPVDHRSPPSPDASMNAIAAPVAASPLQRLLESTRFQAFIIAVIVLNAITLGFETDAGMIERHGELLHWFDRVALLIFTVEIVLKLIVYRLRFFRDPWNVFDFIIVAIALVPASGAFSVLRAMRILRALRLVSMVQSMRRVVAALLSALPGMGSIITLLTLVLYIAAVMGTKLFAATSPEYFGSLGKTLFTLFQVMTMEGWADIARDIMAVQPWAWVFFLVFIMVSTFTVLNLFIAVVVNAMQENVAADLKAEQEAEAAGAHDERELILSELRALRASVDRLQQR
ncbi:MAG: ion transporter [Lysobacterales bacterium]